jgi:hypothetical protein
MRNQSIVPKAVSRVCEGAALVPIDITNQRQFTLGAGRSNPNRLRPDREQPRIHRRPARSAADPSRPSANRRSEPSSRRRLSSSCGPKRFGAYDARRTGSICAERVFRRVCIRPNTIAGRRRALERLRTSRISRRSKRCCALRRRTTRRSRTTSSWERLRYAIPNCCRSATIADSPSRGIIPGANHGRRRRALASAQQAAHYIAAYP